MEHWLLTDEYVRNFRFFTYSFNAIDVELRSDRSQAITFAAKDYDSAGVNGLKEALDIFFGTECADETDGIYSWNTDRDGMIMLYADSYQVILRFAFNKK